MAQEFRQAASGGQNGARVALLLAALVTLLALSSWAQWERAREVAGIPVPPFARIVADPGLEPPPGDACRLALHMVEEPVSAHSIWEADLLTRGWERVGREEGGDRYVYRRRGERILVAVDRAPESDYTRLRLTLRPCPDGLAGSGAPAVVGSRPGPGRTFAP